MSAGLHRVTIGLTQEELARLDHYRERVRLPRGTALRIAAMETIPEVPADRPRTTAMSGETVSSASEPTADQPELDIDERIRRLGQPAGVSSASEPTADQPMEDIDARIARIGREIELKYPSKGRDTGRTDAR